MSVKSRLEKTILARRQVLTGPRATLPVTLSDAEALLELVEAVEKRHARIDAPAVGIGVAAALRRVTEDQ